MRGHSRRWMPGPSVPFEKGSTLKEPGNRAGSSKLLVYQTALTLIAWNASPLIPPSCPESLAYGDFE